VKRGVSKNGNEHRVCCPSQRGGYSARRDAAYGRSRGECFCFGQIDSGRLGFLSGRYWCRGSDAQSHRPRTAASVSRSDSADMTTPAIERHHAGAEQRHRRAEDHSPAAHVNLPSVEMQGRGRGFGRVRRTSIHRCNEFMVGKRDYDGVDLFRKPKSTHQRSSTVKKETVRRLEKI
jgi:hypothetical protein